MKRILSINEYVNHGNMMLDTKVAEFAVVAAEPYIKRGFNVNNLHTVLYESFDDLVKAIAERVDRKHMKDFREKMLQVAERYDLEFESYDEIL